MSYREKTAALMISLRFNVGYIWYGCCSGPGSVGKHRVGIFVLEHPSWRDPQKLAEFPGSFQKSQTYFFFFCVCAVFNKYSAFAKSGKGDIWCNTGMQQGKIWLCDGSDRLT